jgi:hypothetical protein
MGKRLLDNPVATSLIPSLAIIISNKRVIHQLKANDICQNEISAEKEMLAVESEKSDNSVTLGPEQDGCFSP